MDNRISVAAIGTVALEEPIYLQIGEATIEIRRSIPYTEILDMVQFAVDFAVTDQPILSGVLNRMVKDFAIVKFYTNLDVIIGKDAATIKDIYDEYDVLMSFGVIDEVKSKISAKQLKFFNETVDETANSILAYRNSVRGMMDALSESAKIDSEQMQQAIDMLSGENGEKLGKLIDMVETIHPKNDTPTVAAE